MNNMCRDIFDWIKRNESICGSICWPLFTIIGHNRGNAEMMIFGAFWSGVSIYMFLRNLN